MHSRFYLLNNTGFIDCAASPGQALKRNHGLTTLTKSPPLIPVSQRTTNIQPNGLSATPLTGFSGCVAPPVASNNTQSHGSATLNKLNSIPVSQRTTNIQPNGLSATPPTGFTSTAEDDYTSVNRRKSKPKQTRRAPVPTEGTCFITINDKQVSACCGWVELCSIDPAKRKGLKICTHRANDDAYPHLSQPICQNWLTTGCGSSNCKRPHPIEVVCKFAPVEPTVEPVAADDSAPAVSSSAPAVSSSAPAVAKPAFVKKLFTAMCGNHMLHTICPEKYEGCQVSRCTFANAFDKVNKAPFMAKFDSKMSRGAEKIDFQAIHKELFRCIEENWRDVERVHLLQSWVHPIMPQPIPSEFSTTLQMWFKTASIARKINYEIKFGLFEGPDSDRENEVWAIGRRSKVCVKDRNCEIARITGGDNCNVKFEDLCVFSGNCKSGPHPSEIDANGYCAMICIGDLYGACDCTVTSGMDAIEKRTMLDVQLSLKQNERASLITAKKNKTMTNKIVDAKLTSVNSSIESIAKSIVDTYRKVHFVSDFGYKPLKSFVLNEKISVFTDRDFDFELPTATPEQIAEQQRLQEEFTERSRLSFEERIKREEAEKQAAEEAKAIVHAERMVDVDSSNPIHATYVSSGAIEHMTLSFYVNDCANNAVYNHWCSKPMGKTWPKFQDWICAKLVEWTELGTNRVVTVERHWNWETMGTDETEMEDFYSVKSEKDNYASFWSWMYGIPQTSDPAVVGTAGDIVISCPQLFIQYKEAYAPGFSVTFSDWIARDPQLSEAMEISQTQSVNFDVALTYVKKGVSRFGLTVTEFASYSFQTVSNWMKVNDCLVALKLDLINLSTYSADSKMYNAFYLHGRWAMSSTPSIEEYKKHIDEGWNFTESGFHATAADSEERIKAEVERFKKAQKTMALMTDLRFAFIVPDASREKNTHKKKATKNSKQLINRKVESVVKSDSVPSVSFNKRLSHNLAGQCTLPRAKSLYIFRKEETQERSGKKVALRKICIGPFADEALAKTVLAQIRSFNKTNDGRGMSLNVVENTPETKKQTVSWDVVWGDTYTYGREQKVKKRGTEPYLYLVELAKFLCFGTLRGLKCGDIHTNLCDIQKFFEASEEDEDEDDNNSVLSIEALTKHNFSFGPSRCRSDSDSSDSSSNSSDSDSSSDSSDSSSDSSDSDSDSDSDSGEEDEPIVIAKPVAKPVVAKPVVELAPMPAKKEKITKEQVLATLQAKKEAKLAEQLALKAKKEAVKHMSKSKPVVELVPIAYTKSNAVHVARDFDNLGKISCSYDADVY